MLILHLVRVVRRHPWISATGLCALGASGFAVMAAPVLSEEHQRHDHAIKLLGGSIEASGHGYDGSIYGE